MSTRRRAIALYRELYAMGKDYPDPAYDFRGVVRRMFEKNRHLTEPEEIENALKFGEYIKKETLALYSLKKYRHLKRMYPNNE
ncbi:hypothetical protein CYLTODRAFT_377591 [Cylindrobasidium torrendii FP15055 ss-10]|uniref:Complex 1 LYR protein domain-containing protein n=1 Tax=Cylindrobasidium torrendii FP15055 ss-10 TaxID=1314674 RepID=A0A0D7B8H1_9AGAR|nr:hypothetical protein CYLTODRAFT_377591 [Cylindrobasidium torrendii FP15055 ss-10]